MVDISVIIVSWNTAQLLLGCLRSLTCGANRHPIEIIVVDNASTDGSPEAVQREFPNVTLIQNEMNLGFAKANNIGIRKCTGRYICLINSDVVVTEGCLDRMCAYMEQHPSIAVLGPQILNSDSTIQLSCREFPTLWNSLYRVMALDTIFPSWRLFGGLMRYWGHDTTRCVDVLSGCFWMVRRKTLNEVGLLDEEFFMYSEDVDYCKRCSQKGWEIVYFPGAKAVHYGEASSSHSPTRFSLEMLKANLQYWRKHHSRPAQVVFLGICLFHQIRRVIQGTVLYLLKPSEKKNILVRTKASVAGALWLLGISSSQPMGGRHK